MMSLNKLTTRLTIGLIAFALPLNAQVSLTATKSATPTACAPGETIQFTILYSCSSLTDPCDGGIITDVLPAQFDFVSALGTSHTNTPTYNAGTHRVTWPFLPTIPAGSTGQLKVTAKAKTGLTPSGALSVQNCVQGTVTNSGIVTSNCVNVTINVPAPTNLFTITKTKISPVGTPYLGNNVTYEISVCNPANAATNGGINLMGATVKDVLPPDATFVSATLGGTYSNGTVTWNLGNLTASNAASCVKPTVTVSYANPPFSAGQNVTNTATLTGSSNGSPITIGPATVTHGLQAPASRWTFSKTKVNPSGQAFINEDVTYEIAMCNPADALTNGGLNSTNTIFTDNLLAGATFVSATLGGFYNAGTHTVAWNIGDQTVSNTAFCTKRQVTVRYPTGTFTNGQSVCNAFSVTGNIQGSANGSPIGTTNACHTVNTFVPVCAATVSGSIGSNPNLVGEPQTYSFALNNTGNRTLNNFVFETAIPDAIQMTTLKTGSYSGGANVIVKYQTNNNNTYTTWGTYSTTTNTTLSVSNLGLGVNYITKIRLEYGAIPAGFSASTKPSITGTLLNPSKSGAAVNVGNTISNCSDIHWECDGNNQTQQSCVDFDVDVFVATPTASVSKSRQASILNVGGVQQYSFNVSNSGNVALSNFQLTDAIPLNLKLTSLQTGIYNGATTSVMVKYTTNVSGATYLTWPLGPYSSNTNSTLNSTDLGLAAGQYVTNVRLEYGTVPTGWSSTTSPKVIGTVINPGNSGVSIALNSTVSNVATVNYDYLGTAGSATSTANFTFNVPPLPQPEDINVSKSMVNNQATYNPGDTIRFQISIVSDKSTIINPIVADLLPAGLDYKNASWTLSSAPSGAPQPNFVAITNYNGTGRTLLRWTWADLTSVGGANRAYTLPEDANLTLRFTSILAASTPVGLNTNSAALLTNSMDITGASDACNQTKLMDINDLDGDGNTTESICSCTCTNYQVATIANLESIKWDKGELDATWMKYPAVAKTVPGGTVDYQLRLKNVGNIAMKNIVLVDVLPYIGDKGVVLSGFDRLSEWRPVLIAPLSAPAGVKVYYSTEKNPCRDELAGFNPIPFPTGCVDNSWTLLPPADITTVQAVKFDFGTLNMAPADEYVLEWKMIAPPSAPQNNEVAWNSFGYVAQRADDNSFLLPAEPIKVGIKIQPPVAGIIGDKVWLDTNRNGIQDVGEPGLDGVKVDLYRDNGDGIADITNDTLLVSKVTYDGGLYSFTSLASGGYFVVFHVPTTYGVSPPNAGLDDADSDGISIITNNRELAITNVIPVTVGTNNLTIDQGVFPQPVGALGGFVWSDTNADGLQNEGTSTGLNGITVKIYRNTSGTADPLTDVLVATTTTQNDIAGRAGYYLFDDLTPANYYVVFVLNNGFTFAPRGSTGISDAGDADPNVGTGITEITTIAASEIDLTWDAGVIVPSGTLSLGSTVWLDTDNDGIYEAGNGELGINEVVVNLYKDTNNDGTFTVGIDELFATTTTRTVGGIAGTYLFTGLPAGNYIVQLDNSNFDTGQPLENLATSSGNGTASDPDNNIDEDDNGEAMAGQGIVSKAITLSAAGEPTNDGDTNSNTNLTLDFGVYAYVCNPLTQLTVNDIEICSNAPTTHFTVQTDNTTASGIQLVCYNAPTQNPYDGLQLRTLGTATGNGTSATFNNMTLPTTIGTYYVYAILTNIPSEPACRPFAGTTLKVIDCNCQFTNANLTVFCNNNGTLFNTGDDYMDIQIRPVGQFLGFTGFTYSGAFTGSSAYGVAVSLRTAAGTAGAGNLNLQITDNTNAGCSMSVPIVNPGVCSSVLPCPVQICLPVTLRRN
ncbi:MAG: hypothetical protein RL329_749 [Bacteroidota bacterium]